jgi:hypothetical protein
MKAHWKGCVDFAYTNLTDGMISQNPLKASVLFIVKIEKIRIPKECPTRQN